MVVMVEKLLGRHGAKLNADDRIPHFRRMTRQNSHRPNTSGRQQLSFW